MCPRPPISFGRGALILSHPESVSSFASFFASGGRSSGKFGGEQRRWRWCGENGSNGRDAKIAADYFTDHQIQIESRFLEAESAPYEQQQ